MHYLCDWGIRFVDGGVGMVLGCSSGWSQASFLGVARWCGRATALLDGLEKASTEFR